MFLLFAYAGVLPCLHVCLCLCLCANENQALVTSVSVVRKATRTSWGTWWQLKGPQAIEGCPRGGIEGVWYMVHLLKLQILSFLP